MKWFSDAWLVRVRKTAKPKLTRHPMQCLVCKHDMGRSRVNMATMSVRCNNCKTPHTLHLFLA